MEIKNSTSHIPVLLAEVLDLTQPKSGETILDATLGLGGHAMKFWEKIQPNGKLIGLETDERNLTLARKKFKTDSKNLLLHHTNFSEIDTLVARNSVDVALFDLGVSSPHFDDATRGFSFQQDGPLDMRLDARQKITAAEILNTDSDRELTQIFREYGEIKSVKKLVATIYKARKLKRFSTTNELTALVTTTFGHRKLLPQVFQALRIAVNDELENLKRGLTGALESLKPGGRLAVISFHSLEDQIVKTFFTRESRDCLCSRAIPICQCHHTARVKILTKKPILPSSAEIETNPRSRSAKLRVAMKTFNTQTDDDERNKE